MSEQSLAASAVLGEVRRPAAGWDQRSASDVNQLVRQLALVHGWRRLVVRMHPATWSQVAMHLNYNLSFPIPGVPMDCAGFTELGRIVVEYRG